MASITSTVSSVSLNTALTSKQERILDPKVAVTDPRQTQAKPGKVIMAGAHKADTASATQAKQLHQIADGVRSGKLSAKVAETLLKGQQDIFTATKAAMADGKLTAKESIELAARRNNAQKALDAALSGKPSLGSVLGLDKDAKAQAAQLDKLATGISTGNITRAETGHLLGQQVAIADARGDADTAAERNGVSNKLASADKELERHGKAGTQLDKIGKLEKVHVAVGRPIKG